MVDRRLALIAAIFAAAGMAGCRQSSQPAQNRAVTGPSEPKASTPIPLPEPKIEREQLIFAALRAVSAAALGEDDAEAQKALVGRQFELRMRFGCPGESASAARRWDYDANEQVLRAHVSADLMASKIPASDLLLNGYEGAVGFVVDKPLLLSAGCPAPEFASAVSAEPTIAIAQLFTSEDSRVQRPQQSYEITKKLEDSAKPTQGLELVIDGRIAELSDRRPIHCAFVDGPPTCILATKLDRVAIENPADGTVLGEWSHW